LRAPGLNEKIEYDSTDQLAQNEKGIEEMETEIKHSKKRRLLGYNKNFARSYMSFIVSTALSSIITFHLIII